MGQPQGIDVDEVFAQVASDLSKIPSLRASYATFMHAAMGFYHAVAWKDELWLQLILAFELSLLLVVLFVAPRVQNWEFQTFIFILICSLVTASEGLNRLASTHWKSFSTQNYFDTRGVFAGTVFAGPMLLILFIHTLFVLRTAAYLVVKVKRKELHEKRRQERRAKATSEAAAVPDASGANEKTE